MARHLQNLHKLTEIPMKIDTQLDSILAPASTNSANNAMPLAFQAALSAAQLSLTDNNADSDQSTADALTSLATSSSKTRSARESAMKELQDYLSKTPEQRMRDAILKQMGLTEDDIKKMPPEQQSTVEAAIKEKVKEKLLEQAQKALDERKAQLSAGNGLTLPTL
jgi:hypothetical protein